MNTLDFIYVLDLVGTFAFATYGSYYALKKEFDIFGISVAALLTAVGGGTIREMILNTVPVYFHDMSYIGVVGLAVLFTVLIYRQFHRIKPYAMVLDSIGLVTFAVIGAARASEAGLGMFAMIFLATITAIGGGLLRDVLMNKVSKILYYDFYAAVAVLVGLLYAVFEQYMHNILWVCCVMAIGFILRVVVIKYSIHLWKPQQNQLQNIQ